MVPCGRSFPPSVQSRDDQCSFAARQCNIFARDTGNGRTRSCRDGARLHDQFLHTFSRAIKFPHHGIEDCCKDIERGRAIRDRDCGNGCVPVLPTHRECGNRCTIIATEKDDVGFTRRSWCVTCLCGLLLGYRQTSRGFKICRVNRREHCGNLRNINLAVSIYVKRHDTVDAPTIRRLLGLTDLGAGGGHNF